MPNYKITAFYRDSVSSLGWTHTSYRSEASSGNAAHQLDVFLVKYMAAASVQVNFDGALIQDDSGGQPAEFFPPASFTTVQGQVAQAPPPIADGFLLQGQGGPVNKGRSEWLLHGMPRTKQANANQWDLTDAALQDVVTFGAAFFRQYRKKLSSVRHWPIVTPPQAFATFAANAFIRLRRVGRPLSLGGQGLRTR